MYCFPIKLSNASEKYFTEGLQKADYYRDQVLLDPVWVGSLAEKLGIAGVSVTAENFTQLFNNINPATSLQVTPVMAKDRTCILYCFHKSQKR